MARIPSKIITNISDVKSIKIEPETYVNYTGEYVQVIKIKYGKDSILEIQAYSSKKLNMEDLWNI